VGYIRSLDTLEVACSEHGVLKPIICGDGMYKFRKIRFVCMKK
jgi:hypothetical protein